MKAGWQTKQLGDICDIYQPKTISFKEMTEHGKYPVFGANGIIGRYDKYNHEDPQLLVTCRGATCGSVNISEPNSWITGNAMVVRPKSDEIILPFLAYLFRGAIDISKVITGAAQPQITRTNLAPTQISYPSSVQEQHHIVAILDEAFAGIATATANAERNLNNARELFKSHLQSVFTCDEAGWQTKQLGDICQTGSGGTPLKSTKEFYEGGTIPWIVSGEVSQGEVTSAKHFITKNGLENSSARLFPKNTILVAMYGATAGETGILRFEASTNQAVCGILPNKYFVPEFLYYCMLSKKEELISQAVGNAQPNISQIKIRNTEVPIPPLPEQHRIVTILDSLSTTTNRMEAIYQQKHTALNELKQSVLHQAFSGQLH